MFEIFIAQRRFSTTLQEINVCRYLSLKGCIKYFIRSNENPDMVMMMSFETKESYLFPSPSDEISNVFLKPFCQCFVGTNERILHATAKFLEAIFQGTYLFVSIPITIL